MEVRTGDTAAVIGCGPIGLKFVRMLSRRGVRVIALARRSAPLMSPGTWAPSQALTSRKRRMSWLP